MSFESQQPPPEDEATAATRLTGPRDSLPDDPVGQVADPGFPPALRGYDRAAVDAYVDRVVRLVAELQSTGSPRAAVRQALERVGEETTGILRGAHETADTVTTKARLEAEDLSTRTRAEADELTRRSQAEATQRLEDARREAEGMIAEAQQRAQDLDRDADLIWQERARLIDDVRRLAGDVEGVAAAADGRYPPEATDDNEALAAAEPEPFDIEEVAGEEPPVPGAEEEDHALAYESPEELEGKAPEELEADVRDEWPEPTDPQATVELPPADVPAPPEDEERPRPDPDTAEFAPAPEVEPTAWRGPTVRRREP